MARGLILAARHPRPIVPPRICYGRTDVALAEPAERGAEELLASVAELVALDPIARVITSPLSRAAEVGRAVASAVGATLHVDDRLAEMDFGAWENRPWSALPRAEIDAWAADPLGYRPGGGEGAGAMLARLRRAWRTLSSSAATTLIVTHAGPIRCLRHIALGEPILGAMQAGVPYGSVTVLGGG